MPIKEECKMLRARILGVVVITAFFCAVLPSAFAQPAIQLNVVASSLSSPVLVTHAGDARLFVMEQTGQIKIYQGGTILPTAFLDVDGISVCCGEQGLLGLAFHPNYPTTPYFFVHFTSDGDPLPDGVVPNIGDNVVVRYTVSGNPNLADPASGKTMLVMPNPFGNHNGGMIEFGPDGFLYIGKGDGGSGGDPGDRAQNINLLLGKILRIDVDLIVDAPPYYEIPPTNPFAGMTPGADEIFLYGLRNPWRFSFDRTLGDLWIGDVGQGTLEEIDHIILDATAPGRNLGWRVYEGTQCTGLDPQKCAGGATPITHTPPVAEYDHSAGRCSVTGGYRYRGTQISALVGSYIYADFCTGEIFRLNGTTPQLMLDTPHNISSFGEGVDGELYVTNLGGQFYKINPLATAAQAVVAGRVTDSNGNGIGKVRLMLYGEAPVYATSNGFGYYHFPAVPTGQTYVLTPASKRYTFTPANRVITLLNDVTDADFVGTF
jgi:glucose/arabinose dehydrogenase